MTIYFSDGFTYLFRTHALVKALRVGVGFNLKNAHSHLFDDPVML